MEARTVDFIKKDLIFGGTDVKKERAWVDHALLL